MKRRFSFRGQEIHYRQRGKGKTIIFIHGFLGQSEMWKEQFHQLSSHFRTIAIDLPAHGKSPSLGYVHSMELLADMIHALFEELRLRKVILVGHSLGGYISLAFAEKYTDLLEALILVNSTAAADTPDRKQSRGQLIRLLPEKGIDLLSSLVRGFFVTQGFKRRYWLKTYLRWTSECNLQGIVATIRGMMERKEREIILKFAPYPYLIVAGEEDPLIDNEQSEREAALGQNGEFVLLEESGHMSPMEQAGQLSSVIRKFLKKVTSR